MVVTRLSSIGFALLLTVLIAGCSQSLKHAAHESHASAGNGERSTKTPERYTPTSEEEEADKIYMLLAFAVVHKNWQYPKDNPADPRRGYNIGSVLVDPSKPPGERLVCWARNATETTNNGTQHGEVRLLTN